MATDTLYVNDSDGFVGYGIKRDGRSVGKCSRMDEVIVFGADASMRVIKVDSKTFVGKHPAHVSVFDREKDKSKVFHMIYRDGRQGPAYVKRFTVGGITRDKVYELGRGTKGSRVLYFRVFDDAKAADDDVAVVHIKPALRLRNLTRVIDFSEFGIKSRGSKGNLVTKHAVARVARGSKDESP